MRHGELGLPLLASSVWACLLVACATASPAATTVEQLASPRVQKSSSALSSAKPDEPATVANISGYCVNRLLAPIETLSAVPARARTESYDPDDFVNEALSAVQQLRRLPHPEGHDVQLETFVALVPDPIDSGLVYQFETGLQALRLAFEVPVAHPETGGAKALYRDRAFLPWDDRDQPAEQRSASESCRYTLPGLMLFRNSSPEAPVVSLVFLVGETPTSGVRSAALLNALRLAARIDDRAGQGRAGLPIIGPTFSGTAYSLRLTLERFVQLTAAPQKFQIRSGSASGADLKRLLDTNGVATAPGLTLDYQATTVPEASVECAYAWFLRRRLGVDTLPGRDPDTAVLKGVATLSESGTEFGGAFAEHDANRRACGLEPELQLSFPVHASFLRDAYEDMDRRAGEQREPAIARQTALSPALEDVRTPLDVEANPSPKTRAAVDVLLSNVLSEISRRGIQYVSIRATDVGDAIFLARKIRDVAPDVRLAFFEPDDLLLHPDYRSDLLGSLVVSPYPFLGVSDFRPPRNAVVMGFANASAEGLFNAALAQRDAHIEEHIGELMEYAMGARPEDAAPVSLLVWVSAIARSGLVPLDMKPPLDCLRTILGPRDDARIDAVCQPSAQPKTEAWAEYNRVRDQRFPIDSGLELPRLWNFLYLALVLAFLIDAARQNAAARGLATDAMPLAFEGCDERAADRAIGRTKWRLYAAIRCFLFVLAFVYMGAAYALALIARDWPRAAAGMGVLTLGLAYIAVSRSVRAASRFRQDALAFARFVAMPMLPLDPRAWLEGFRPGRISSSGAAGLRATTQQVSDRMTLSLGLSEPVSRAQAARVSFAQLRIVVLCTVAMALGLTFCLVAEALVAADAGHSYFARAVPLLTLNVLRNVPLLNGVSQATPALLSLCGVYLWATGRMARLALAHGLSRAAPPDGETDLVSTPIRLVLFPKHQHSAFDDGYTRAERDLLNSIWRPITGRYYTAACLGVVAVPIVLFWLKPLSTLEGVWGTRLLAGGLGLSAALIGITQIQLIQYFVCLQRLLARTALHPFAAAFRRIPEFARASLDRQMSRPANDLLRWSACAEQFRQLTAALGLGRATLPVEVQWQLRGRAERVLACARRALRMENAPDASGAEGIELREQIIAAASEVRVHMEQPGLPEQALAVAVPAQAVGDDVVIQESRACIVPPSGEDLQPMAVEAVLSRAEPKSGQSYLGVRGGALAASAADGSAWLSETGERVEPRPAWVREAEVFIATVVTLLIHSHMRQFRHFMSTLVGSALLLLLAVTSYPFQPYRLLITCIWVVVSSVAGLGLYIYLQLGRDDLIAAMSGKEQRVFTSGFLLRLVTWAVLPLASAAAAQYPDFANRLFQLVSPFLRALR